MSPGDLDAGGAAHEPPRASAPGPAPAAEAPPRRSGLPPLSSFPPPRPGPLARLQGAVRDYFVGDDPTFWVAMVPLLALSALLYTRSLTTNFIFDEQEALLANPYVHGKG
ncbi:MAG TPA: tetratricopeptide repeat protein, partial [Polyangiaceae bacterium]|nr:tetratricopeptide repeat protein [Polyangiaceae bacterium]